MNKVNGKISKILTNNTCFTLPNKTGETNAIVIGEYLYLFCIANTYSTDDYIVVINGNDNITKVEFIANNNIPPVSKFGFDKEGKCKEEFDTYDISNPAFCLNGQGSAIAIFNISTLELYQVYYFPCEQEYVNLTLDSFNDMVIVQGKEQWKEETHTYVFKVGEFGRNCHAVINGVSKRYGKYLVVIPFGYYDVACSLSLVDLENMQEYILSEELKNRNIEDIGPKTIYDNTKKILYIFDGGDNEVARIPLNYIVKHCKKNNIGTQKKDFILPGCCTDLIE